MKVKIFKSFEFETEGNIIELECEGKGTENDPIIIKPSGKIPKSFILCEINQFIDIRNLNIRNLNILVSKNITIENCLIDGYFKLTSCSNIIIKNVDTNKVELVGCRNCTVNNCVIKQEFRMYFRCSDNSIKNCNINKIFYNNTCERNVFKYNQLSKKYLNRIEKIHQNGKTLRDKKTRISDKFSKILSQSEGFGTKEDPIIVKLYDFHSNKIKIYDSVQYMIFNELKLNLLVLSSSKNKILENCIIKKGLIGFCSNIKIKNCHCHKLILLNPFDDIIIEDSQIKMVTIDNRCKNEITIENSIIDSLEHIKPV